MAYFDGRHGYAYEHSYNNRLRRDEYIYTDGNGLISLSGGRTSVASSEYPTASPRYHPYTFYYDQPKSNSRIYNYYDRYRPRDVRSGRGYYSRDKLPSPYYGYAWNSPVQTHLDKRNRDYKDETTSERGGFNVKICVSLVILLLVLLTAAGLGIGLGVAFDEDGGKLMFFARLALNPMFKKRISFLHSQPYFTARRTLFVIRFFSNSVRRIKSIYSKHFIFKNESQQITFFSTVTLWHQCLEYQFGRVHFQTATTLSR